LERKNFCFKGYCDENTKLCRDDSFQDRVHKLAENWKECMFQKERGNHCENALSKSGNSYDDCLLGVEMF